MTRMYDAVAQLVALESYVSPAVPTRRFGRPAVVGIASPNRPVDPGHSEVPSHWFAGDAGETTLLAFASTKMVTPIRDFRPAVIAVHSAAMHPRDAHAIIRNQLPAVRKAFFADEAVSTAVASEVAAAYAAAVPPPLLPWLQECCVDFFAWLDRAQT